MKNVKIKSNQTTRWRNADCYGFVILLPEISTA